MHYQGSLDDLKAVVSLLHLPGHWVDEGAFHIFSCDNGDHINVWPDQAELQVKGHPASSRELQERLAQALSQQQPG